MQALLIFVVVLLGIFLPYGAPYTWLIRPSLMLMLFFAFLGMEFYKGVFRRDHFIILIFNLLLPILFYFGIRPFSETAALAAFMVGVAPTAAGAPVFADFLRTRVESVTASVLLTSPIIALLLPLLLSGLVKIEADIHFLEVLLPICMIIFIPLAASLLVKFTMKRQVPLILKYKRVSFYLFLTNLYIAASKASVFIRQDETTSTTTIFSIAAAIAVLSILNFGIGQRIGHQQWALANSLSLGRKNTMFAIWVSLTFINPAVALGPMFYILAQNLYNGWQLYLVSSKK